MNLTLKQEDIKNQLAGQFSIDPERIYFLNEKKPEEPWLPAEALITIARQSGEFQGIDETVAQYIQPLNQVVHSATAVDKDGRSYTRSGVATIGEREDLDAHALAAGRAVSAALTAAGFNPLRPGVVVSLDLKIPVDSAHAGLADEAQLRNKDLKQIHALAVEKNLIRIMPGNNKDMTAYRALLKEKFGTNTAAAFDATQRASLINHLSQLPEVIVDEFADVA